MDADASAPEPGVRPRHAVLAVCVAMGVLGVNTTAVGIASRGIADELGVTVGQLEWIMSAYLVTAAAFALVGGRMGDVIGRSRTLLIGVGIMIAGSVVAALAPGTVVLVGGRAVQGLGAALILPASIEVLAAQAPTVGPSRGFRARGVVYSTGFGIGPLIGALLTDTISWRAVFWIEALVLLVAGALAWPLLRAAGTTPRAPTRDYLGAGLAASAVFLVVFGASRSRTWGWWSWPTALVAVVVVALLVWLARVERRTEHPLLHGEVLRDHSVIGANLATLGASIGMIGLVYFYGLFAQSALVFDSTVLSVALGLVPFTVSIIGFAVLASFLSRRLGGAGPVLVGLGLSVIGFAWLSTASTSSTEGQMLFPLVLCGIGAGVANAGLTTPAVMSNRRRIDEAAGLLSLTRSLGAALAIAIGTASYLSVWGHRQAVPSDAANESVAIGGQAYVHAVESLQEDLRRPFETATHVASVQGFSSTMRFAAIAVAVLTVSSALFLASGRGRAPVEGVDVP